MVFALLIIGSFAVTFNFASIRGHIAIYFIFKVLPVLVLLIWYLAIYDFLRDVLKLKNDAEKVIIPLLICAEAALWLYTSFRIQATPFEELNLSLIIAFELLQMAIFIAIVVVLTKHIKAYLYARSTWWIVVEILVGIIGIFTLTPTLQEEYKHRLEHGEPTEEEKLANS